MREFGCPGVAEVVEEAVQCGFGPSGSGPHEAAGVGVDHDDQIAVRPFVRDLIDPDPTQTIELEMSQLELEFAYRF